MNANVTVVGWGMLLREENRCTCTKTCPMSLCPPQIYRGLGLKLSASGERQWTNRLSHAWSTLGPCAQFAIQCALPSTHVVSQFGSPYSRQQAQPLLSLICKRILCFVRKNTELVHTSHHLDKLVVTGNCTSNMRTARHGTARS